MDSLQIRAIVAGALFGLWPLFLNRSGLNGTLSVVTFAVGMTTLVILFAFPDMHKSIDQMPDNVRWPLVLLACITGAIGLMLFNRILTEATPQTVGTLFVIQVVVQTTIPAAYTVMMNGGISWQKAAGFMLAGISAVLLTRSQ